MELLITFQDKSTPTFYLGQEAEFDIKDGVCTPKIVSSRFFNSADGAVAKTPIFTKEACEEVSKLYIKHKDKISKCDESNKEVNTDLWQSNDKIKELYNGGMGMYGMGYGFGGQSSQLTMLKGTCDMMVGEFSFGMGISPSKEVKPSSAIQQ